MDFYPHPCAFQYTSGAEKVQPVYYGKYTVIIVCLFLGGITCSHVEENLSAVTVDYSYSARQNSDIW